MEKRKKRWGEEERGRILEVSAQHSLCACLKNRYGGHQSNFLPYLGRELSDHRTGGHTGTL